MERPVGTEIYNRQSEQITIRLSRDAYKTDGWSSSFERCATS
jgi:hypothetical protein